MTARTDLIGLRPQELVDHLLKRKIRRFHFVRDPDGARVRSSHPELQPLADFIEADRRDYMAHEGLFFQISRRHFCQEGERVMVHFTPQIGIQVPEQRNGIRVPAPPEVACQLPEFSSYFHCPVTTPF